MFLSFARFCWFFKGFTEFYWVLLGFTGFLRDITGFHGNLRFELLLLDLIGFYWILLSFIGFDCFLLGFTKFYWVSLAFKMFHCVLLGFIGFYWVVLGCTGLNLVLLGFIGLDRVWMGVGGSFRIDGVAVEQDVDNRNVDVEEWRWKRVALSNFWHWPRAQVPLGNRKERERWWRYFRLHFNGFVSNVALNSIDRFVFYCFLVHHWCSIHTVSPFSLAFSKNPVKPSRTI